MKNLTKLTSLKAKKWAEWLNATNRVDMLKFTENKHRVDHGFFIFVVETQNSRMHIFFPVWPDCLESEVKFTYLTTKLFVFPFYQFLVEWKN